MAAPGSQSAPGASNGGLRGPGSLRACVLSRCPLQCGMFAQPHLRGTPAPRRRKRTPVEQEKNICNREPPWHRACNRNAPSTPANPCHAPCSRQPSMPAPCHAACFRGRHRAGHCGCFCSARHPLCNVHSLRRAPQCSLRARHSACCVQAARQGTVTRAACAMQGARQGVCHAGCFGRRGARGARGPHFLSLFSLALPVLT